MLKKQGIPMKKAADSVRFATDFTQLGIVKRLTL